MALDLAGPLQPSSCENPQFPNWVWRYNRDKHLSRFQPWFTRVERWHPLYRHMGVGDNFRFHPVGPYEETRPAFQGAVNYAHELVNNREVGFGNAALGHTPGPAPPRYVNSQVSAPFPSGELYKQSEIYQLSGGFSLLDNNTLPAVVEPREHTEPLNPRQYLDATLGQKLEFPGTFPHINGATPPATKRSCTYAKSTAYDPMTIWVERHKNNLRRHALERSRSAFVYPETCRLPREYVRHERPIIDPRGTCSSSR